MEEKEVKAMSDEEMMEALAVEGGFADIIGALNSRLHAVESLTGDKWVTGALVASDAAAGVFTWQNTTGHEVEVTRALLRVTTQSTGACTVSVGMAATAVTANN